MTNDPWITKSQDELWDAAAAQRYDTPGEGMFADDVLAVTVDRLASLADGGRALEFAIGTGRVAIPLHERGVEVVGIEASSHMIDRLREKVDESQIPVIQGDMKFWPSELDLMARIAGFSLESRYADWDGSPFTVESRSHVSIYRLG